MKELATIGGGCFWCTEAIFQQVAGVTDVVSGYSGGNSHNPTYQQVCEGQSGHAEVVQVSFDPDIISYADVVRLHLSSHDPTTLNRQGADKGTQYRSVIFAHDDEQSNTAVDVIAEMQPLFDDKIITEVKPINTFYKAEDYHQKYYSENSAAGYCQVVIAPKLQKFRQQFADRLK